MDEAVRSGGELFEELSSDSPDLLCAVDRSGRFVAVNPAWERTLGWASEELIGSTFDQLLDDGDHRRAWHEWQTRVLSGEVVGDFENHLPHRDGGHRWISWSVRLAPDKGVIFCCGRDVTALVRLDLRQAHDSELLVEAERVAGIGIWEWDVERDQGDLSEGLSNIFGTPAGEPLGFQQLLKMVVPEDRGQFERQVLGAVDGGGTLSSEFRLRRPDGREIVVFARGEAVVERGRTVSVLGTFRDITQQRIIEAELRHTAEVEQGAAERLRHLDQVKNTFLSAVSHELRTPLAVVRGLSMTLQRLRGRLPSEKRNEIEDALVAQAERLEMLLDRLLDVDRLAKGTFEVNPESFDAVALVRRVVSSSAPHERVVVVAPETLDVRVDPLQLERTIVNLLQNADKYAGPTRVTVTVEPLEAGGLRLRVSDEGPGIDRAQADRIFEPYYRGNDEHPHPGTGIGLALIAQFASLHGGRAWAEPNTPQGLTVVVELPDLDQAPLPPAA